METKKTRSYEAFAGVVAMILTAIAIGLFLLSYTTKYYTFGQMNSGLILLCLCSALVLELASLILRKKLPNQIWPKFLTYAVTALLAFAAMTLVGDRVEAIGTTIITDYDAGHGGEEAIYFSLGSTALALIAMVFNILGSFEKSEAKSGKGKRIVSGIVAAVLCVAVLIPVLKLTKSFPFNKSSSGGKTSGEAASYSISLNQQNGNVEEDVLPDYQFLSNDMGGLLRAESRLYVDITLNLDGQGGYDLFSDCYVIESGKRCVIGDDSGMGLVYTTKAQGSYTENEDGTVTVSVPTHAVAEIGTDTYSSQMKSFLVFNGHEDDGIYDSAEYPEVLDFVPETTFTLADGKIVSWHEPALSGAFTVSLNQQNGNVEEDVLPDYQFLSNDMGGMLRAESRLYVDVTLNLDGAGNYDLFSDCYVIESGKRAEIGDDTGMGLVFTTKAQGAYTDNGDGTVTISVPTHAVAEIGTDTYSSQMKGFMTFNGHEDDGVYDSAEFPEVLDFVPETIFTLESGKIISWSKVGEEETPEDTQPEEQPTEPASAELSVPSDDGATEMVFRADGSYTFIFADYNIEDPGAWTYEDGVLTVTNAAGQSFTAEGDPLKLHYVSAVSDQLAGDFTIEASALPTGGESQPTEGQPAELSVLSDDEGTEMVFSPDGTYVFKFEAYNIEDPGAWTYEDGVLTVTNAAGQSFTAEGDPLKLHYVSAVSDQLAGDFTIEASALPTGGESQPAEEQPAELSVLSDDEGTEMVFKPDGTYVFKFEAYNIEDPGAWTYEDGVLIVTNGAGQEFTAEGDPLKLHYVSAVSDQLAGDFTIEASALPTGGESQPAEEQPAELSVLSDDEGTEMVFKPDGTYVFKFEAYNIEDPGAWTYEDGVLIVTNGAGQEFTAEGDPLKLHYVSAVSDQLAGDFTIEASALPTGGESQPAEEQPAELSVLSDDEGTEMVFKPDGTYVFKFEAYNIEDPGTWTYEDGVLTVTNAAGQAFTAEGDPLKLHYVSAVSDQLAGDFTIPASDLP